MNKDRISQIVQEEVQKMLKEAKEKAPKTKSELEKLRDKLKESMRYCESLGDELNGGSRKQKRVHLKTVSELLEIPINELMLYFISEVKNTNERHLVEYRQGYVVFYADE